MQAAEIQLEKLNIIEQIINTNDIDILDNVKYLLNIDEDNFKLTDEHKKILDETMERYYSGTAPSYTWEEVKANARNNYYAKAV